jgi:Telomere resolvase
MAVPRWLHTYWMQQLWPALSQGEVTADRVKQLLEESLQSFQQRSGTNTQRPLSEQTIGRYVTATRNWLRDDLPGVQLVPADCRKLSASEMTLVLQHFNPPAQWWAALNDRSRERVEQRPQVLLPDPQGILTRIHELLGKEDWAPLAVALAGATGRRVGEVIYSGSVTPKSGYSIFFRGRLKRGGDMQRDFEIPTLVEAPLVLEAWERLRTHPEIAAMDFPGPGETKSNQVLQVINQRLSPVVRKVADHYFQDLVPTSPERMKKNKSSNGGGSTPICFALFIDPLPFGSIARSIPTRKPSERPSWATPISRERGHRSNDSIFPRSTIIIAMPSLTGAAKSMDAGVSAWVSQA